MYNESEDDPFVIYALAKEYEKANRFTEALDFYLRLIEDHPNYVGTYYHLGGLYEKINQQDKAKSTYQTGLDVAKKLNDDHAYRELFSALSKFTT